MRGLASFKRPIETASEGEVAEGVELVCGVGMVFELLIALVSQEAAREARHVGSSAFRRRKGRLKAELRTQKPGCERHEMLCLGIVECLIVGQFLGCFPTSTLSCSTGFKMLR